jgi:hypothetical protein
LNIGLAYAVNLRTPENHLQQFFRRIEATGMFAESEAFTQALSYYNSVKQAVRDDIPGAQSLFEKLKKRFVIGRPKKGTDQTL